MFSIKNKYNKILLISVVILTIFGIIMIYSASHIWALYKFNNFLKYAIFQLLFAGLGFILMKIISKIDYKIDNINNDITFKKKVLCDLKNYEVKKKDIIKFIISSLLTTIFLLSTIILVFNPIKFINLTFNQNFLISICINTLGLFVTSISTFETIKFFPSKVDKQTIANLEKEIANLNYNKEKLIEELNNVKTIKKDIDDLKAFYINLYRKEYPQNELSFQKKKFR